VSKRRCLRFSRGVPVQAVAQDGGLNAAGEASTCVNDFPDNYVIVSNDPAEIERQIKLLESENQNLRERLEAISEDQPIYATTEAYDSASSASAMSTTVIESDEEISSRDAADALGQEKSAVNSKQTASDTDLPPELEALREAWLHKEPVQKATELMNIVFVTSEVAPYSKTGGLGDVCGSLPAAFKERGHRTMVIAPRYLNGVSDHLYENCAYTYKNIKVWLFGGFVEVALFHEYKDGVDFVFVDHPAYHREGTPYGDDSGTFGDNLFRYTLLNLVACEIPLQLELGGFAYGDKCVFVANDWHGALTPVFVASKYRPHGVYKDARTILAIHNMMHHGTEPSSVFPGLGLPDDWYGAVEWVYPEHMRAHELDKGEAVNPLKGAIVTADRIVTVSQGYANEITTPEGGFGLEGLLRGRRHVLNGITNGVDIDEWNPATDPHIPFHYFPGSEESMSGKAKCKAELQKELGFPVEPNKPLIAFIGRLDFQKGPDLIRDAMHDLAHCNLQLVMLGSGNPEIEEWMQWAEGAYPNVFRGWRGFSIPVAHRLMAGSDILLMPSRFEPCGLNQLYAMRYGTVPVAHATGGLKDTIEDFNPYAHGKQGAGTGLTFSPANADAMKGAVCAAVDTYYKNHDAWKGIMERGMEQDFSWNHSAEQWEQVFSWALGDPPYA